LSLAAWSARLDAVAGELLERPPGCCDGGRRLPSPSNLAEVVASLRVALFAEQLGPEGLDAARRRQFVRGELDRALAALVVELGQEPGLVGAPEPRVEALCDALPAIRATLLTDLQAAVDGDPAVHSATEVLLCYPGFSAILHHRVAHELHRLGAPLVARAIAEVAHASTAIDIHPGAQIGPRCFIDHGTGVVIGETAIVGAGARLYQGVTLGARSFPVDANGQIIRGAPRHPILEDDVTVFAGASILGRVIIGRGSVIGGGVWLTRSVPSGSRIVQAAARTDSTFEGGAGI
jgi:serine O-acetyltransferase